MGSLRLFLAIAVVNAHAGLANLPSMLSGGEAVQLFFVISGFYMALILSKKYHSATLFYSNRFLRLYPAYAFVLLVSVIWFWIEWAYTHQRPPPFWIAQADAQMPIWQWLILQFSNLSMLGLDLPSLFHWKSGHGFLFLHAGDDTAPDGAEWGGWLIWIRQAWSIGTEIWFYLLAPFIVRRSVLVQIAIAGTSCTFMVFMERVSPLTYYFFPANLWFFLSGSLLFQFYRSWYFPPPRWVGLPALICAIVVGCSVGAVGNPTIHNIMLIVIALSIPLLFHMSATWQWDAAIGNLSYPVYLVHIVTIGVLAAAFRIHSGVLAAIISVLVSMLIVRFIDSPMDKYRQWRVSCENGTKERKQKLDFQD
jgi:peptidoglycan/LPS O-acetylase OafA/YrhL